MAGENTSPRRLARAAGPAGICFLMFCQSPSALAQKTDLVYLRNGDRLTAEVKDLAHGEVRLETSALGTVYVKWQDVDRIETDKQLQVQLTDGRRYFGAARPSATSGLLTLDVGGETLAFEHERIVRVQPIIGTGDLRGNLDLSLGLGLTYTRASDLLQWNIRASTKYRTEKYIASASYDSLVTNNGDGADSTRRDLSGTYLRLRRNRWLWFANATLQQNDELGVDRRALVGGGLGRFLVQSQKHEVLLAGGLTANVEDLRGSPDATPGRTGSGTSLEWLLYGEWTYFRLKTPKSSVSLAGALYPGLTEAGRLRGDLRARYRQEFVKDLFLNLTYYYNFDTDPSAGAFSETDYGVVTGLEYQF